MANNLRDLAFRHLNSEFYHSALFIIERLHSCTHSSPETFYILLKSLFHLKHHKKIREIASKHPEYNIYVEIKLIYARVGIRVKNEATRSIFDRAGPKSCNCFGPVSSSTNRLGQIDSGKPFSHDISSGKPFCNHPSGVPLFGNRQFNANPSIDVSSIGSSSIGSSSTIAFSTKSLEHLYYALNKKENLRKRNLILSFEADPANIEPYLQLYREGLATKDELEGLLNRVCPENSQVPRHALIRLLLQFKPFQKNIWEISCPTTIHILIRSLLEQRKYDDIFKLAVKFSEGFGESEFVYEAYGIYYMHKKHYKDAIVCFHKALQINSNFGWACFYLGISYSHVREMAKSIKMLEMAFFIMTGSPLPAYALACEYQSMNNIPKAKYYYKTALKICDLFDEDGDASNDRDVDEARNTNEDGDANRPEFIVSENDPNRSNENRQTDGNDHDGAKNSPDATSTNDFTSSKTGGRMPQGRGNIGMTILNSYVYCLINNEDYAEAGMLIEKYKITNLLRVFYFLFTGEYERAVKVIDECQRSAIVYGTRGFLHHLKDDFKKAIEEYEKCLEYGRIQVVVDLLGIAMENMNGSCYNFVLDYANSIFDSLEYRNLAVIF